MDEIEAVEFRADLEAALDTLTERQRTVFVLAWQGHGQEETAAQLGIDQSVVCRHLMAAKTSLANSLYEYAYSRPVLVEVISRRGSYAGAMLSVS